MKIHIMFDFKDGPWGGGNQFLKGIKKVFMEKGIYEENPHNADCILYNSHHNFNQVLEMKFKYPDKIFIHRIDGPVFLIRNSDKYIDKTIFKYNELVADISIFQSNWSKSECLKLGYKNSNSSEVIHNGTDMGIFYEYIEKRKNEKVNIVATSWSKNMRKGFDVYKFLDDNLDFSVFSFTFVGNSPMKFTNIQVIPPLPSEQLADILNNSDLYITASINDPCSNSLIEALNCGLPSIALNDGGHPELVKSGGEIFNQKSDIINKIYKVLDNYDLYKSNIEIRDIKCVAEEYLDLINTVYTEKINGMYVPKKITSINYIFLKLSKKFYKYVKRN